MHKEDSLMLHKFFEPGDWFAPKKRGYGSGLPTAWQGWALIAAYVAAVAVLSLLLDPPNEVGFALWAFGMTVATAAFLLIARNRTPGRWR
jgi:hypothetical protein